MPTEYELAIKRLEILARIKSFDTHNLQLELTTLQMQLSFFEVQLPAIKEHDRSPEGLEALQEHLKKMEGPFVKSIIQLLYNYSMEQVIKKTRADFKIHSNLMNQFIETEFKNDANKAKLYKDYVTACTTHFNNCYDLILKKVTEGSIDDASFQKILEDFNNHCSKEKEKLKAISPNPLAWTETSGFSPADPQRITEFYNALALSKVNATELNEALDHFRENCAGEKSKIESAIATCKQKLIDRGECQAELKAFDDFYFNHPRILSVMPRDQLWKLCIDARDHSYGKFVYDLGLHNRGNMFEKTEPGHLDGMETAIAFVLRSTGCDLTQDFIGQVHLITCYFSYLRAPDTKADINAPYYPIATGHLPIIKDFYSEKGISEVAEWRLWENPSISPISLTPDTLSEFLELLRTAQRIEVGRSQPEKYMGEYIKIYHDWMQKAGDDKEKKLLAIIKLARLIDCSHPFQDGNIRTVRLLMLKLMTENGLTPTMLRDPNILDTYHSTEVAKAVEEGQHTYELECLLAKIDEPGNKEKLKAKIILQCEERHGLFIANNRQKLCELFPEHSQLIQERATLARKKEGLFCKYYCDDAMQKQFEAWAQTLFNRFANPAASEKTSSLSSLSVFANTKEATTKTTHNQDEDPNPKIGPQ